MWKIEIKNPAVSTTCQVIYDTQGIVAANIVFPQFLLITFRLLQGQLALWVTWVCMWLGFHNELWCLLCFSGMVLTWLFQIVISVISEVQETFNSSTDTLSRRSNSIVIIIFSHLPFHINTPICFIWNRYALPGKCHITHRWGNHYGFHIIIYSAVPLQLSPPVPTVWKCVFSVWFYFIFRNCYWALTHFHNLDVFKAHRWLLSWWPFMLGSFT